MTTSNTPFEDGLDEILATAYKTGIEVGRRVEILHIDPYNPFAEKVLPEAKGAITQLHKAAIKQTLETLRHNLEPDLFGHDYERLVDEINNCIEQYKKEGKDEQYT